MSAAGEGDAGWASVVVSAWDACGQVVTIVWMLLDQEAWHGTVVAVQRRGTVSGRQL
jgi:hypothetical protein